MKAANRKFEYGLDALLRKTVDDIGGNARVDRSESRLGITLIDEPEAYALLRGQAMSTNRRIAEIAEAIVTSDALLGDIE